MITLELKAYIDQWHPLSNLTINDYCRGSVTIEGKPKSFVLLFLLNFLVNLIEANKHYGCI